MSDHFSFRMPKAGESWDAARERGHREDAASVIRDDGRHRVGPKEGDWLYEGQEVITVYQCPTCYREVTKRDGFEGPWVHVNRLIDPEDVYD